MPPAPSLPEVIDLVEADAVDARPLNRLRAASTLVRKLTDLGDAALGYFVDQARHAGHSWSEIGEALGVTKQAAQQRHTVRSSASGMTFERFTPRARKVVDGAEPIAREWGHDYVGTEHLLLSLLREPDGLGAQILIEGGLPEEMATAAIQERVEPGTGPPEGALPFRPEAKTALISASAMALDMGHSYIGTEHVLLGLAREDGIAGEVLEQAGLDPDVVTIRITEKLARYADSRRAVQRTPKGARPKASSAKQAPRTPKGPK
jgi:hypothetical protein